MAVIRDPFSNSTWNHDITQIIQSQESQDLKELNTMFNEFGFEDPMGGGTPKG